MATFDVCKKGSKLVPLSKWVLCLASLIIALVHVASHAIADETHTNHNHHNHSGHHSTLEVLPEKVPSAELEIRKDKVSGWNIKLLVENFSFTPDSVNGPAIQNQGHAHIYLNDKKIARLYSPFFHLDSLPAGEHTIKITLNADDHSIFVFNTKPIEAVALISVPDS